VNRVEQQWLVRAAFVALTVAGQQGSFTPFPCIRLRLMISFSLLPPELELIFCVRQSKVDRNPDPTFDRLVSVARGIKAPVSHRV
jgi:hypothetical protein